MKKKEYVYEGMVESVFDGDTLRVSIDLGFGVWLTNQRVDLVGIDTPEVILGEKYEGQLIRDWLRALIESAYGKVTIRSHENKKSVDYWAVELWVGEVFVNEKLLELGFSSKT